LLGFVTTTATTPATWAGVLAVMDVLLTKVTADAAVFPNLTTAPFAKFAPLIVTVVPPPIDPELGATLFTDTIGLAPTATVIESVALGLSKLSTVLDALRTQTVIR
jgi:hypothetical protein